MSINAGSVSVEVVPDARLFAEKLRAKLRDISVQVLADADTSKAMVKLDALTRPTAVKVDADTTTAKTKLDALRAEMKAKQVQLGVSTASARLQLAQLQQQIAAAKSALKVNADDTEAKAKLAALQAQYGELQLKVRADTAAARLEIEQMRAEQAANPVDVTVKANTKSAERNISNLSGGVSNLAAAAVGLGPALIPVTAAVGGLAAAFAAPIAAAGGGLTVYGILTGAAVKKTEEQKKQIQELAKGVQSARTALANANAAAATSQANSVASAQRSAALSAMSAQQSAQKSIASAKQSLDASLASAQKAMQTATTAAGRAAAQQRIDAAKTAYQQRIAAAQQSLSDHKALISKSLENSQASASASATASQAAAQRQVNEAVKKYRAALHELTPDQRNFLNAQDDLKQAFGDLVKKEGSVLLGPLTQGMRDLDDLLPRTAPLLKTTSGAVSTLLDEVDRSARSGSLARFDDFIETWGGYSIVTAGRSLGNIASGVAGIVQASAPLSGSVMDGLERMTGTFAKWGQNAGNNNFQDFLAYVHKVGPQAGRTLLDVAGAFGAIAKDAAPVGGAVLKGLDAFANILHRIADSEAGPPLIEAAAGFVAVRKALQVGAWLKGGAATLLGRGGLSGGVGTIAGKALGKGVVPVFVTNPGFGGTGPEIGPKGGVGGRGPRGSGSPLLAASPYLLPLLTARDQGPGGTVGKRTARSMTFLESTLRSQGASPGHYDSALAAIMGKNPQQGLAILNKAADILGKRFPKYLQWLGKAYPQTQAAVKAYNNSIQNQAALTDLLLAPSMKLGKVYESLPKQVKTEIATPGAIQSTQDVKALKKQYDLTPKQVRTILQLTGVKDAQAQLRAYTQMLADVNGKIAKTFIQQIVRHPIAGGGHVAAYRSGMADGGTVPGVRFPYHDKILMPVAPGEEVISNYRGQADKWRPLLKAINSGGMAAGGTVGGSRGGGTLQQEIRGTLAIDRNGVAYIHGVAREAVNAGTAREQAAARRAASGVLAP